MPTCATAIFKAIHAVDLERVPVVCTDRCTPRKEQAVLARKLLQSLGIKGISVTAPRYSMAQSVDVSLPNEPHPGWTGFEEWQHRSYSEMPDFVPAKTAVMRKRAASDKIEAILSRGFPNHDDRSDSMTDYFDYCWSVS